MITWWRSLRFLTNPSNGSCAWKNVPQQFKSDFCLDFSGKRKQTSLKESWATLYPTTCLKSRTGVVQSPDPNLHTNSETGLSWRVIYTHTLPETAGDVYVMGRGDWVCSPYCSSLPHGKALWEWHNISWDYRPKPGLSQATQTERKKKSIQFRCSVQHVQPHRPQITSRLDLTAQSRFAKPSSDE